MKTKIQLVVYWAIVLIPLSWGVYKTAQKTGDLFQMPSTAADTAPVDQPPPTATPVPLQTDGSPSPAPVPAEAQATPSH